MRVANNALCYHIICSSLYFFSKLHQSFFVPLNVWVIESCNFLVHSFVSQFYIERYISWKHQAFSSCCDEIKEMLSKYRGRIGCTGKKKLNVVYLAEVVCKKGKWMLKNRGSIMGSVPWLQNTCLFSYSQPQRQCSHRYEIVKPRKDIMKLEILQAYRKSWNKSYFFYPRFSLCCISMLFIVLNCNIIIKLTWYNIEAVL